MPKSSTSVLAILLWLALCCSAPLHAAVDMFLDLGPTMPGESLDSVHKGKVDVLAWSWGVSNSGTTHRGRTAGGGTNSFQNLSVTKYVDKSSPLLMQACAKGTHIPTVTLIVRKAGETPIEYIKIVLTEVLFTSVSTGGSGGADRLTENVTLTYAQLQINYVPTRIDGTPDKAISFNWDVSNDGGAPLIPAAGLGSTLSYTNGSPIATLTWASTAGVSYQVWATTNLNSPFQAYGSPIPSSGVGTTTLLMPANALQMFFRIQTVRSP